MLTARGITMLAVALAAWIIGRSLGINPLYAVSTSCAAVVGGGVAYVRLTTSSVSARRRVAQQRLTAGGRVEVALELRNDGRVPSPTLLVAEQLPAGFLADGHEVEHQARFVLGGLGPGRIATAEYTAVARTRGRYEVGPVQVRVRDPFGVAERVPRYTQTAAVIVYPRIEVIGEIRVKGAHLATGTSDTRVLAGGDDFYTMREYVRGDDLRHVHWPSTAHRQTLMVRQMEQSWQAHATVFLDSRAAAHTPGPTGSLERAVSAAASIVHHLADAGYVLRLLTDRSAGRGGPTARQEAMDQLAVLEPSASAGIGPALASTRGAEGLFVAVLGTPPGVQDPAVHPDLRALMTVRGVRQRVALVVGDSGARMTRTAALLDAAGWQATTLGSRAPLAPAWAAVLEGARRRVPG